MSPLSYDPKAVVGGPAATLTIAGLAGGLLLGLAQPVWGMVAGAVGAALWVVGRLVTAPWAKLVGRLGIGLVVGAVVGYALVALEILPQGLLGTAQPGPG